MLPLPVSISTNHLDITKTPSYTKWFSYQPGETESRALDSQEPVRPGAVIAEAETTESRMYWSCTTGNLRGLGTLLSGSVEILAEEMSAELAKPAALQFNHPMAAHLVLPEGGLVPGVRFSLVNGAREIVFRYYDDGSITPVGVDTDGGGQASLSDEEGDKVFTWQDNAGNAWAFSAASGELLSYSTDDGVSIGNVAEYLAVVRNPEDDSLRQIWSYWDGLPNIENVTVSRTRTELEPAALMDTLDVWQLVTETSKAGVVASRVCEVYQSTPVGNLLLTKVEGYGGTQELDTTYTYDVQNRLTSTVQDNGRSMTQALNCQGDPLWTIDEDGSKLAKTGVKVGVGFAIGGRINMDWHAKLSCGLMGCSLSEPVDFSLEGTGRMLIFATEVEYSVKQDLVSGGNLSFSLPFGLLA